MVSLCTTSSLKIIEDLSHLKNLDYSKDSVYVYRVYKVPMQKEKYNMSLTNMRRMLILIKLCEISVLVW